MNLLRLYIGSQSNRVEKVGTLDQEEKNKIRVSPAHIQFKANAKFHPGEIDSTKKYVIKTLLSVSSDSVERFPFSSERIGFL